MVEKGELFAERCDECGKSKMSIRIGHGLYVCIRCFVKRSSRLEPGKSVPAVYISVSGGVISVDRKTKGVMVIIREHDEEQEPKAPKPYLITYPEDSEVKLTYDFFKVD